MNPHIDIYQYGSLQWNAWCYNIKMKHLRQSLYDRCGRSQTGRDVTMSQCHNVKISQCHNDTMSQSILTLLQQMAGYNVTNVGWYSFCTFHYCACNVFCVISLTFQVLQSMLVCFLWYISLTCQVLQSMLVCFKKILSRLITLP